MAAIKHRYPVATLTIVSIAVILTLSLRALSWKFAYVGDEYPHLDFARKVAAQDLLINPFGRGVWQNFAFGSLYQAFFLAIFNPSLYWWRFSSIFLLWPCSLLIYSWGRTLFGVGAGLSAGLFLLCSFYLWNFSSIGYPNTFGLFWFLLGNALLAKLIFLEGKLLPSPPEKIELPVRLGLGLMLGFTFYVYCGPLLILLLSLYLLIWLITAKFSSKSISALLVVGAGALAIMLPGLLNKSAMADLWGASMSKQYSGTAILLRNIGANFLLLFHNLKNCHFVAGPYLDVITQFFCVLGLALSLAGARRPSTYFLLSMYCLACFGFGLANPYMDPPITRGFFFLPFGFLWAGYGASFIVSYLPIGRLSCSIVTLAVFATVLIHNVKRAEKVFLYRTEVLALRAVQDYLPGFDIPPLGASVHLIEKQGQGPSRPLNADLFSYLLKGRYGPRIRLVDHRTEVLSTAAHTEGEIRVFVDVQSLRN